MQPTLKPGDYLLVRKAFAKRAPDRWTILIFRKPSDGTVLVKRVVGLPGESLAIRDGDLLVDERIAVKPESLRASLREPLVRQRIDGPGPHDGWTVSRDGPIRRYGKPLFADEPSYEGEVASPPRPYAHDVYFEAEVGGPASIRIEFTADVDAPAGGVLGVAWSRDAAGREVVGTLDDREVLRPLAEGRAPAAGGPSRVTLAVIDGRLRLWAPTWEHASDVALPEGRARLGVEGDVRAIAVDRDVHYTSQGVYAVDPATPFRVPEGHVFCLGDHSAHSGDSRLREVGPIPFDKFIGPVVFRILPPWRIGFPE
jgi:hypothetical protein